VTPRRVAISHRRHLSSAQPPPPLEEVGRGDFDESPRASRPIQNNRANRIGHAVEGRGRGSRDPSSGSAPEGDAGGVVQSSPNSCAATTPTTSKGSPVANPQKSRAAMCEQAASLERRRLDVSHLRDTPDTASDTERAETEAERPWRRRVAARPAPLWDRVLRTLQSRDQSRGPRELVAHPARSTPSVDRVLRHVPLRLRPSRKGDPVRRDPDTTTAYPVVTTAPIPTPTRRSPSPTTRIPTRRSLPRTQVPLPQSRSPRSHDPQQNRTQQRTRTHHRRRSTNPESSPSRRFRTNQTLPVRPRADCHFGLVKVRAPRAWSSASQSLCKFRKSLHMCGLWTCLSLLQQGTGAGRMEGTSVPPSLAGASERTKQAPAASAVDAASAPGHGHEE
jgi:hypothetical protein